MRTELSITDSIETVGRRAREAAQVLATASTPAKNAALVHIAQLLERHSEQIQAENAKDLAAATSKALSPALLDRLALGHDRVMAMAEGLRQIAALPDPVGSVTDLRTQPSGIVVGKMRMPLGVIGIIYESRPNVTADAAALCLKSGNAAILRGGSEAIHSNRIIARYIGAGLAEAGLPAEAVQLIDTTDRAAVSALLRLEKWVDVIIPRGGKGLIERVSAEAKVPVIKHLDGICHVYIDQYADADKAIEVAFNSKTFRYGICGAMETLLVAESRIDDTLRPLIERFIAQGVELRGCARTQPLHEAIVPASEQDWATEYLAPILSIKVVDDLDEAMAHIARYGSGHTDAICTDRLSHATRFQRCVDSASVMVNAATCFADGFQYGLGAEIGISTNRLHVRGPVGLEGLTLEKFVVTGDGAVRR